MADKQEKPAKPDPDRTDAQMDLDDRDLRIGEKPAEKRQIFTDWALI